MDDDSIESYFGRYDRKSPARQAFIDKMGEQAKQKGFPDWYLKTEKNSDGQPRYETVSASSCPELYQAIIKEASFRKIDVPACYIDTESSKYPIAYARADIEAIFVSPEILSRVNKDELSALVAHEVKHLYSGIAKTEKQKRQIENDCDRASVESAGYDTVESFIHKAVAVMIDTKVPITILRQFAHRIHDSFPNLIANNFWLRLDSEHPAPAQRMVNMREHEATLQASDSWVSKEVERQDSSGPDLPPR